MVTLNLKINRTDFNTFGTILREMFNRAQEKFTVAEWLHYYNTRSLLKRTLDKAFNIQGKKQKMVSLSVNINEFNSLTYLVSMNSDLWRQDQYLYYKIVLDQVIGLLDKQSTGLMIYSPLSDPLAEG